MFYDSKNAELKKKKKKEVKEALAGEYDLDLPLKENESKITVVEVFRYILEIHSDRP